MKTAQLRTDAGGERGAALVEFAIAGVVFLTAVFAVIEFGRLLWTHNALADAARRGARYAVSRPESDADNVRRMAVYGTTADGANSPMVFGLTEGNVKVEHSNFNVGEGTVTVSIVNYDFNFVVPVVGTKIRMPAYASTLTGESAGQIPANLP
ncbi:MAG TPA: TadE family protein [Pyrinomonadaceae bacterium]|nr:TadE family protein [Pyrinomonadaceae bacterium]